VRGAWLPIALLVAAGCQQGPSPEVQARLDSLSQASSQRDRLMQEVAENTRLRERDQPRARPGERPARALKCPASRHFRASRDTLIQKIRLHDHAGEGAGARLKESEQRIKDLTSLSDSLRNELASTMQNLQGVIDNQKETIDALTLQVETLTAENSALRDTLENMSTISNTVYYVVGTKDELEQKGIISEEGGARFLFVLWKSGRRSCRRATSIPASSRGRPAAFYGAAAACIRQGIPDRVAPGHLGARDAAGPRRKISGTR